MVGGDKAGAQVGFEAGRAVEGLRVLEFEVGLVVGIWA